jgi:hypothetical protein
MIRRKDMKDIITEASLTGFGTLLGLGILDKSTLLGLGVEVYEYSMTQIKI